MVERTVVLGVTGSIAAYKAVDLASRLTQAGVSVYTVMTQSATRLIAPATFRALTGRPVAVEMFDLSNPHSIEHVSLADAADVLLVAPATANTLAKLAQGMADDLLSCTALATRAPLLIAPAMHTAMWEHPATQSNVATLLSRGARFVGPTSGRLASGGRGTGRFAPVDDVLGETLALLGRLGDLSGRRFVVTAGGTREPIDLVRFVGNRSSGKMGYAIAEAARDRGASVVLISAPSALRPPAAVTVITVESADEMRAAVRRAITEADVLVMAAAVADYAPASPEGRKIKKTEEPLVLALARTPDILATTEDVGPAVRVGFAIESEDLVENARRKLSSKRLDLVVANAVSELDSPFDADESAVVLVDAREATPLARQPKRATADAVLDRVVRLLEST